MKLEGKTAIITGGSVGIGKAIATTFAREGANMVLISRTRAELTAAMQEITQITEKKIVIFPADISDPRAVKKMADFTLNEFQRIDILVNCAGIQGPMPG